MNSFSSPEMYVFFSIIAFGFFFISFFSIETGLILLAVSMLFSPEISIGSLGIRDITLRIEDILIPVLVLALVGRSATQRHFELFRESPLNAPIFSVIAISIVSTIWGVFTWGVRPMESTFYILKTAEFFIIFFLTVNYVKTERQIKLFLFFAIVTVGLVGIYTLTQVPHVEIFTENRITAPFEGNPEPGTIGGYMAFLIVIVFSIYLYEKRKVRKWLFGVLGLILLIPLLFTLNRSSYAALVAGVAYITYVERKRKWLVTIVVCLFLTSPLWLPHSVKDRIAFTWRDAKNPGRTMGVDISFEERIVTYEKMWRSLKVSPLIGWGVGSFQTPDSQYARTLHEVGMIGLGFWLWIYFRLFRMARWLFNYLEGGMLKGMVLGYRAGLIGILLHGFGAVTWYIVRIMEPFWFITGLVVSLYLMKVREASRSAVEEISEEPEEALAPVS